MTNWKTTLFGVIAAAAAFVLFSPQYFPPWAVDVAKFITAGGLAALGIVAKDAAERPTLPPPQDRPQS